ncbi:MAG: DUF3387 domain-containing protein, partial [Deltaproteobacteria bacterium]|nr:DUF3387 domain-containing protein [Deltaproteobacteria bacterium]
SSSESIKSKFDIQTFAQVLSENNIFIKELNDQQRKFISEFIVDYALNKTGIDWQIRESIVARFRMQIRRQLKKIKLNENLIESAVEFLIEKAIELSLNAQKNNI